jgi:hypothetical protein
MYLSFSSRPPTLLIGVASGSLLILNGWAHRRTKGYSSAAQYVYMYVPKKLNLPGSAQLIIPKKQMTR